MYKISRNLQKLAFFNELVLLLIIMITVQIIVIMIKITTTIMVTNNTNIMIMIIITTVSTLVFQIVLCYFFTNLAIYIFQILGVAYEFLFCL